MKNGLSCEMKFFCNFVSIKNFKIQILYLNLKVLYVDNQCHLKQ